MTSRFHLLSSGLLLPLLWCGCAAPPAFRGRPDLGDRLVVGYWHNWRGEATRYIPLDQVPETVNRVNVAFAVPAESGDGTMVFAPTQVSPEAFRAGVLALRLEGAEVLISVGGGNHPVELHTPAMRDNFVRSIKEIIDRYGFDGLDIDLEGASTVLDAGDMDFRNPTTPKIVRFIEAMRELTAHYGPDFVLSAAPETQYVTAGYHRYGEAFGGYLPILHALRDELDVVHMQYYNSGSQYLFTGVPDLELDLIAEQGTVDFVTGLTEMLILGFPVARDPENVFPGLGADKVAIGLPASPSAAKGGGFMTPEEVRRALDTLRTGRPARGAAYRPRRTEGHPELRGLMTWSINWDETRDGGTAPHEFTRTAAETLAGWENGEPGRVASGE